MSSQLFYFFTFICVLNQTYAHFGTADGGGRVSGSLLGDLFRAGGNVKYQLADVSDNAANRIRSMFHKKSQPSSSFGFQTGYVIQAAPYGNAQPPVGTYGNGAGAGGRVNGNIGYDIGIVPASSYDSYRPSAPSGSVGGHVNAGGSLSSGSGTILDEDHLEYVSSTGVRRRLSYEEVVQLVMAVVESSKSDTGYAGFTGGYTGVPTGGYTGGSMGISAGRYTGGYPGVPTGGYPGVPTGGYPGVPTGGYPGVPTGGYPGVPTGGYAGGSMGISAGGYTGVSAGGYTGVPAGPPAGGYTGVPTGPPAGGYTGVPTGPPAGGYTGVPTGPPAGGYTVRVSGGPTGGGPTGGGPSGGGPTGGGPSGGGPTGGGPTGGGPTGGGSTGGGPTGGGSTGGGPSGGGSTGGGASGP